MAQFDGGYRLLFEMPSMCVPRYLALSLTEQKQVNREAMDAIMSVIDTRKLASWSWETGKITTDADGFKSEREVREELNARLEDLGTDEVQLVIPDSSQVLVGGSKSADCGQDQRYVYPVRLVNRGSSGASRPWIIPSRSVPEIVFEVRVSLHWIGPPGRQS